MIMTPTVALLLLLLTIAPATVVGEVTCTPSLGTYTIRTKADAAAFDSSCTYVRGNLYLHCTLNANTGGAGGINSLSFLSNVQYIDGYLTIEDCDVLPNLNGLANLRTIAGTYSQGLSILNNDQLTDLKGLENLQSIALGGVKIFRNDQLCYADLFKFDRISTDSSAISYTMLPASCTAIKCDGSCTCGWCAGSGSCGITCDKSSIAWIAAPIILGVLLLALLIFVCYKLKKKNMIGCECYMSLKKPLPKTAKVAPVYQPLPVVRKDAPAASSTVRSQSDDPFNQVRSDATLAAPMGLPRLVQQPNKPASPATQPRPAPPRTIQQLPSLPMVPAAPQQQQQQQQQQQHQQMQLPGEAVLAAAPSAVKTANSSGTNCICGKPAEFDCSRCGVKGYCSSECQRSDWKGHREECRRFAKLNRTGKPGRAVGTQGTCVVCSKTAEFECSRCSGPSYCSATCQRTHWLAHANECSRNQNSTSPTNLNPPPMASVLPPMTPDNPAGKRVSIIPMPTEEALQSFGAASPTDSPEKPVATPAVAVSNDDGDGGLPQAAAAAVAVHVPEKVVRPLSSVPEIREPEAREPIVQQQEEQQEEASQSAPAGAGQEQTQEQEKQPEQAQEQQEQQEQQEGGESSTDQDHDISIIDFTDPNSRLRA